MTEQETPTMDATELETAPEATEAETAPEASEAEATATENEAEPVDVDSEPTAPEVEPAVAETEEPASESDATEADGTAGDAAAPDADAEAVPEVDAASAVAEPAAEPEAAPAARPSRRARESVSEADAPLAGSGPRGLRIKYDTDVVPALRKQFEYVNPNQVPKVSKVVVNIGLGEALSNAKAIDAASGDIILITGQKPIVMKAKRSIAQFRVRTGNPIGLKVTLRGQRMWDFLERLTMLALPRIRDFRGIPGRSFDGRGNYTLGLREQIAFPEIDYDKVDRLRGLEISIVTTAKSDEESKRLLELLGMPFAS